MQREARNLLHLSRTLNKTVCYYSYLLEQDASSTPGTKLQHSSAIQNTAVFRIVVCGKLEPLQL